jgi:PhnB protein
MTGLTPYLTFDGTAREALSFYRDVFGGELVLNTLADFGRTDGPADAIAHGMLQGPVELFAADATGDERPVRIEGMLLSLLGTAEPDTMERWFAALCEGGSDVDQLQLRPWGAHDGQVTDRFGLRWLLGYELAGE